MSRPQKREGKTLRSDIGWSTAERISIFGKDLPSEILGHVNLGDMGFLEINGRLPNAKELALSAQFLNGQRPLREFALAVLNLNSFAYVE